MTNPWGSCPILHNGSNFRVPDYSRYFNELTDAANDDDNVNNTCFVYSQKHPTLEIPSKLNIEAEILMRGIIEKSDTLFVEGVKDEKLAIAMGMCHPKARVRHVALFFFSIHPSRWRRRMAAHDTLSGLKLYEIDKFNAKA